MTNEEAIKQIEMMIYYYGSLDMENDCEALNMAIEAINKQTTKKPEEIVWDYGAIREFKCPTCEAKYYASGIKGLSKGKYCEECGQKLDWE